MKKINLIVLVILILSSCRSKYPLYSTWDRTTTFEFSNISYQDLQTIKNTLIQYGFIDANSVVNETSTSFTVDGSSLPVANTLGIIQQQIKVLEKQNKIKKLGDRPAVVNYQGVGFNPGIIKQIRLTNLQLDTVIQLDLGDGVTIPRTFYSNSFGSFTYTVDRPIRTTWNNKVYGKVIESGVVNYVRFDFSKSNNIPESINYSDLPLDCVLR